MIDEGILQRIRILVQDKGTSPAALAAALGLDPSSLAKQLRGDRGVSLATIRALLADDPALNPDWLLHGSGERLRPVISTPLHPTSTPAQSTSTPAQSTSTPLHAASGGADVVREGSGEVCEGSGAASEGTHVVHEGGGTAYGRAGAVREGATAIGRRARARGEGLPLLPMGAVAGYEATGYDAGVTEDECERYSVPGVEERGATMLIRVDGDSMLPTLTSGDVMALKPLVQRDAFSWGRVYVLDTESGCFVKRVVPSRADGCVTLHSDNPVYPDFDLSHSSIRRVYDVVAMVRML